MVVGIRRKTSFGPILDEEHDGESHAGCDDTVQKLLHRWLESRYQYHPLRCFVHVKIERTYTSISNPYENKTKYGRDYPFLNQYKQACSEIFPEKYSGELEQSGVLVCRKEFLRATPDLP